MKRRKPPVVLASLLVVFVGVAVIISLPKKHGGDEHGAKMTAEEAIPDGSGRPTPPKEALKAQLGSEAENNAPDEAMGPLGKNPLKNNPKSATVFLPKAMAHKPAPNDSAVSGQWFRDEARASNPEAFKTP